MFEAKLTEGHILKKIVEAIKDLVTDVNIDVSASGKCLRITQLTYYWYRPFSPSYGYFPCCTRFLEFKHGGIRILQMRSKCSPWNQH